MKKIFRKYLEKLREHFKSVWEVKHSPFSLALGFAIGTFLAMMPFSVGGIAIGLLIILIFKKVSKVTMFLAFTIFNPLIEISLQFLSYYIGTGILAGREIVPFSVDAYNTIFIFTQRLFVGSFMMAFGLSIIGFFIFYFLAKRIDKRREIKSNFNHNNP